MDGSLIVHSGPKQGCECHLQRQCSGYGQLLVQGEANFNQLVRMPSSLYINQKDGCLDDGVSACSRAASLRELLMYIFASAMVGHPWAGLFAVCLF
jgi:hypothetical protein